MAARVLVHWVQGMLLCYNYNPRMTHINRYCDVALTFLLDVILNVVVMYSNIFKILNYLNRSENERKTGILAVISKSLVK